MTISIPVLVLVGCTAVSRLAAQQREEAGRPEPVEPVITEETLPNEVGEWDLRLTADYWEAGQVATVPHAQLFFGIARRLGAELSVPLHSIARVGGGRRFVLGNAGGGLKWLLLSQSERRPALVLGSELELPAPQATAASEEATEVTLFLGLVKQFGRVSLQGNIPFTLERAAGTTERRLGYNAALGLPIAGASNQLLLELNGDASISGGATRAAFSPGLHHALGPRAYAALAVPVKVTGEVPAWRIVLQYQVRL